MGSDLVITERKERIKAKPCHLPRWLLSRDKINPLPFLNDAASTWINILDHFGYLKFDEGKIYVSEPYGPLDMETIRSMIKVCDEHNIGFKIHSYSPHYPNRTILIEWFQTTDRSHLKIVHPR